MSPKFKKCESAVLTPRPSYGLLYHMALRVLLADESSTIKKVMQLSLQDFAVEVRTVAVGLDVLSVAKVYQPDIIFADILLAKKNGYDVCFDLKADVETRQIPVILMWSGFMELDEQKFQHCKADARLEKPFDAETLRTLVKDLVQKTKTNPISDYLTFAQLPDFEEPVAPLVSPKNKTESENPFFADSSEEELSDDFSSVPLTAKSVSPLADAWSETPLKNIKDTNLEDEFSQIGAQINSEGDFDEITFIDIDNGEPITNETINRKLNQVRPQSPAPSEVPKRTSPTSPSHFSADDLSVSQPSAKSRTPQGPQLSLERQEEIFREEARAMAEKICWQILPELAERMVKDEINKLLKDVEKSI